MASSAQIAWLRSLGVTALPEPTAPAAKDAGTAAPKEPVATKDAGTTAATADAGTAKTDAAAPATDAEIEALDLSATAKAAAYKVKKAHPEVTFTSGRRSTAEQAGAMAENTLSNRKWIGETYYPTNLSKSLQKWVDDNPDKKTKAEITEGLLKLLDAASEAALGGLSKHLSGNAFDVQPVTKDADAIKKTLGGLGGKFLDKEGGLVRWHVEF